MPNQIIKNNLNFLIDPTFTNVNRLSVLSYENENDRTYFSKYYVPKVEIKDFNVWIDGKPFFEIPLKNRENDYPTGTLLDYEYFKDNCELIGIDLSKQIELKNPDLKQQISFTERLEENNAKMFFTIEKKKRNHF